MGFHFRLQKAWQTLIPFAWANRPLRSIWVAIDARIVGTIPDEEIDHSLNEYAMDDGDKIIQQINLEYSGLYSKASSLLTHVSMMVAALSFIFGTMQGHLMKMLILINIIIYLISLILILRVIWVPSLRESDLEKRRHLLAEELIRSQRYLRSAHLMAVGLTFIVILLLALQAGGA